MAERPIRLLLIDDDEESYLIVRHLLREANEPHFELEWAGRYEEGLERFCQEEHELCLLDYRLNSHDGLELLREARRRGCRRPIIMLTGLGSREIDVEAMKAGAADYLIKDDLDAVTLERAIRYVLERQRLLDALEEQSSRLRHLTTEASAAEQRERRRLAQLLHDHLQQLLIAAKMRLNQVRGQADEGPVAEAIQHAMEILDDSVQASRNLTAELCPPVLYDRGVAAALNWLARHFGEQHALKVEVSADSAAEPADQDLQAFLFQAVRELLLNSVKHGGADRAWVRMERREGDLDLSVEDNGVGCEPDQMFNRPEAGGFGLFSIKERLTMLGGSMSVRTAPGEGCRITLHLAVEEGGGGESSRTPGDQPAQAEERPRTRRSAENRVRPIRVMLVDDHRIVREGLAGILRSEPEMELVVEASDGREAVEMVDQAEPDVIVMDVSMPRMDGTEATRIIRADHPDVRVIGLSMHEDETLAKAMQEAGASAYLTKGGPASELIKAIREQARGQPTG